MRVLLTGANGYIGKTLLPVLLDQGHEVIAVVRDKSRFNAARFQSGKLSVLEMDLLNANSKPGISRQIDVAYYLIHSMSSGVNDFDELESLAARHFVELSDRLSIKQIIYLSGISNADHLSKHLVSRRNVEAILSGAQAFLTTLRAGIIVGSGSASFEIMRDLVEKLPVMITPNWLNTKCQPIAISNVIEYLSSVLMKEECFDMSFDIGGPDILTYKEMLLRLAEIQKLKRLIITLPFMTPRLSSYWLYFVTSTSYNLAINLVNSMKVEVVCKDDAIRKIIQAELIDYRSAVKLALGS